MTYLDHGATSFPKLPQVQQAVLRAMETCANPGRGGYPAAMEGARVVFSCRMIASELFDCQPEQVVFTKNCTEGLNIAIRTLVKPGGRVVISGFEHNAVTRPLHGLKAKITVAGRKLFDPEDTVEAFEQALRQGQDCAVFTHCSNVFGYVLPVDRIASLCRKYAVPFIIDAAQSAGSHEISLRKTGADFIAMPGHKGLLGPQGTGLLLCGRHPQPLLFGGTGSVSRQQEMPDFLPDVLEAGTCNVPGIAGLGAGLRYLKQTGIERIGRLQKQEVSWTAKKMEKLGIFPFFGESIGGSLSFTCETEPEQMARLLADRGISVRAGLHCAPLAHESAGTLPAGTVRVSFGCAPSRQQSLNLLRAVTGIVKKI